MPDLATNVSRETHPLAHSKTSLGKNLIFEQYVRAVSSSADSRHSSEIFEVSEAENPSHVLILRTGSPSVVEWRSQGRDRRAELAPGSVSLMPAGMREGARIFRPKPGVASILQINPVFFEQSVREIAKGGTVELIRNMELADPQISRLIESLRADVAEGSPAGSLFAESVATALSAHIALKYSTLIRKLETHRGGLAPARLNHVLDYIATNLDDKIELSAMADVAGLNLYHFARAFKQSTGESPHQYVLRRRINQAKDLLRNSRLSVVEASARTGFVDQSHFTKVFRRIVGVPPSEYRNLA